MVEQVIVHEELGRNTNAVWWCGTGAYNVLGLGTPEQIERYLKPTPARRARPTPTRSPSARPARTPPASPAPPSARPAGYRIRAEKWFVTTGDVADYYIVW